MLYALIVALCAFALFALALASCALMDKIFFSSSRGQSFEEMVRVDRSEEHPTPNEWWESSEEEEEEDVLREDDSETDRGDDSNSQSIDRLSFARSRGGSLSTSSFPNF